MMRASLSIFLAALVLLMISSHDTFASHRRNFPERAPREIEHALGTLDLDSVAAGQRLSVTFWSGEDATSRMENIYLAAQAREDPGLTHIGVNVSDAPELFRAYLERDRLGGDSLQLMAAGDYPLGTVYR